MTARRRHAHAALRATWLVLFTCLLVALPPPPPAGAQDRVPTQAAPGRGQGTATLRLVDQDAWLGPRGTFTLDVETTAPEAGYSLEARLHRAVEGRSEILRGSGEGAPTRTIGRITRDEDSDVAAGTQTHRIEVDVVPEEDNTPGYPYVLDPGVYPIEVELIRPDGELAASFVTYLVHLTQELVDGRVPVGLMAELSLPINRDEVGLPRLAADPVDRLRRQLDALAASDDVAMTVAVPPETVSALVTTEDGVGGAALSSLGRLAGAASATAIDVLPTSFVAFDEAGWLADGQGGVILAELDAGRTALQVADLRQAPLLFSLHGAADPAVLARYFELGIRRVVLTDGAGASSGTATTSPGLASDQRPAPSPVDGARLGAAPHLVRELPEQRILPPTDLTLAPADGSTDLGRLDAIDAYRLLTVLLLDALAGDVSGHQVRLGEAIDLRGAFATTLLRELGEQSDAGPLRPTTIDGLFDDQRHFAEPQSWNVEHPASPGASGTRGRQLTEASARVAGVRAMTSDDELAGELEARLLLVPAEQLAADTVAGLLDGVNRITEQVIGAVQLPAGQSYSVTSHDATLPLVLRNDGDRPVQVSLRLRSQELEFTGDNPQIVALEPGPNDLEIPVRTRRSGEFDFVVEIASPDGSVTLGAVDVRLQSRAISGVGVLISAGALLFLIVWWTRNARRRRAAARIAAASPADGTGAVVEPAPAADTAPPPAGDAAAREGSPDRIITPEQTGRR